MKKVLLTLACIFGFTSIYAQSDEKVYVYGVDFSYVNVYAAEESVEQFAKAFEGINMLMITEPEKYDFSRMFNKRTENVIEPMLKITAECDYSNMKSLSHTYAEVDYASKVMDYDLPQTEGVGAVLFAQILDKPMGVASYQLVVFDIATRSILHSRKVSGKARGFGLKNYWAGSIYKIIRSEKVYK